MLALYISEEGGLGSEEAIFQFLVQAAHAAVHGHHPAPALPEPGSAWDCGVLEQGR